MNKITIAAATLTTFFRSSFYFNQKISAKNLLIIGFVIALAGVFGTPALKAQDHTAVTGSLFYGGNKIPGGSILVRRTWAGDTLTVVTDGNGDFAVDIPCRPNQPPNTYYGSSYSVLLKNGRVEFHGNYSANYCPPSEHRIIATSNPPLMTDNPQNNGPTCPRQSVGEPVNVTNGNLWLEQNDYSLPGAGESIKINRTYNSARQLSGHFGLGWSSDYDESLVIISGGDYIQLHTGNGQIIYFVNSGNNIFKSTAGDFYGRLEKNADFTYSLKLKDGRVRKFNSFGFLIELKDRNGNQTTLNYTSITSNQLSNITDNFGRTLTVTVNPNGTISGISDSLGVIATYDYYPGTLLLQTVTYNDGSKHKFEYVDKTIDGQSRNFLAVVKDAFDNVLEAHDYDSAGRAVTSEKHGGVEKYTLDYTNAGPTSINPHTVVTDALGRVAKYYFDKSKGRNVITKIEGNCNCGSGSQVTTFEHDARVNMVKQTDADGNITTNTYDANGNKLTSTDVTGTRNFTYDIYGKILTATDQMNGLTTNTYDANGNLGTVTDPLNKTTTLTYTPLGQPATIKDARNNTTTLTYNATGQLTQIKDANLKLTNYGYDARARVTSVTNALNQTTAYEYDLHNRLKKIIYPDAKFEEFTYDTAGRRTKIKDTRGFETTFGYDNAYRLTSVTDALNHATTFGYDLMSNRTSQADALGNTTNYEYDNFDRLKRVIYPPATTGATRLEERLEYDAVGNVKKRIDTMSRETVYTYDTAHRLKKTKDANLKETQFEYNNRSQTTKVTDALNQIYNFTYDPLGRQLSQTRAGTTMTYEYDAVGNRTKRTDYAGRATDYVYDNLNRLTNISYVNQSSANATYAYDDLSHLTSAANNAGTVSFTYDNRSRLKTSTDVHNRSVEYGYDGSGNRTQLKLAGAVHTAYAYDAASRLTTLTDEANQNFTFAYDNADRLISKTLPNGVASTFNYDGMSRLTELKHQKAATVLTNNDFAYNATNQISQINEHGSDFAGNFTRTRGFNYDNLDRLLLVSGYTDYPSSIIYDIYEIDRNYEYDAVGNRTMRSEGFEGDSYTYEAFNRLAATGAATYTHDSNGNRATASGSGNFTYVWDYENRMTSATSGANSVAYTYDALGRRVKRTQGANVTKFTYDGMDVVLDDENGTLTKYQNGLGIDDKLKMVTNGQARYFSADHLGSTIRLTDTSGAVVSSASYNPFGSSDDSSLTTRYQYTGREFDSFTGLYYYRARWYDAQTGRFISEDPIGFAGGDVNLYGYVRNKPLNFFDPFGLDEYSMMERLGNQQPSNRSPDEALDELQMMLCVIGLTPGIGEPFDAADGLINLGRGNFGDAVLSGTSMLPFVGIGAGITKIGNKVDNFTPKYARNKYKRLSDETAEAVKKKEPVCQYCDKNPSDTVDHIISQKQDWLKGGWRDSRQTRSERINNPSNLAGACRPCNSSKGSKPIGNGLGEWQPPAW